MRLLIVLLVGGVLGWLAGSLYPAPQSWLTALHLDAIQQRLTDATAQPTATTASVGAATPAPSSQASAGTPTTSIRMATHPAARGPVDEQTLNRYRAWIGEARAAHPYADSEERMYAVMMCESRGQAGLVNPAGSYSGLFQYGPSTWRGAWNTYRDQNILDARAQIFATALAWHNHMQGQWGCYSHAH